MLPTIDGEKVVVGMCRPKATGRSFSISTATASAADARQPLQAVGCRRHRPRRFGLSRLQRFDRQSDRRGADHRRRHEPTRSPPRVIRSKRIAVWGESLGTGVAVALAATHKIDRLILESPFTSAADVGSRGYWFLPVHLLIKDLFYSDARIGKVTSPLLISARHRRPGDPVQLRPEAVCAGQRAEALHPHGRRRPRQSRSVRRAGRHPRVPEQARLGSGALLGPALAARAAVISTRMTLLKWLLAAVAIYGCVLALVYIGQRSLQYHPDRSRVTARRRPASPAAEEIELKSADGETVIVWHVPPKGDRPVVLYFHGNGGSLAWRANRFRSFTADGTGLVALSYRGFGGSTGSPTEAGLIADADASLCVSPPRAIRPSGSRCGASRSAPASRSRWPRPTRSPAWSWKRRSPRRPMSGRGSTGTRRVQLLMKDTFRSNERIGKISVPVLILHGTADTVASRSASARSSTRWPTIRSASSAWKAAATAISINSARKTRSGRFFTTASSRAAPRAATRGRCRAWRRDRTSLDLFQLRRDGSDAALESSERGPARWGCRCAGAESSTEPSLVRRWITPITVSLLLVAITTAILWVLQPRLQQDHLIFIYFVPTTLIAIRYGSLSAMGVTIEGGLAAAYFLYPPNFSFLVASRLELLEIVLFCMLALLASQVVSGFANDDDVVKRRPPVALPVLGKRSGWSGTLNRSLEDRAVLAQHLKRRCLRPERLIGLARLAADAGEALLGRLVIGLDVERARIGAGGLLLVAEPLVDEGARGPGLQALCGSTPHRRRRDRRPQPWQIVDRHVAQRRARCRARPRSATARSRSRNRRSRYWCCRCALIEQAAVVIGLGVVRADRDRLVEVLEGVERLLLAAGRRRRGRDRPPDNSGRARAPCCSRRARGSSLARSCDRSARDWHRPGRSSDRG